MPGVGALESEDLVGVMSLVVVDLVLSGPDEVLVLGRDSSRSVGGVVCFSSFVMVGNGSVVSFSSGSAGLPLKLNLPNTAEDGLRAPVCCVCCCCSPVCTFCASPSHPSEPNDPRRISLMVGAIEVAWAVAAHMPCGTSASRMRPLADLTDRVTDCIDETVPDRCRGELVSEDIL